MNIKLFYGVVLTLICSMFSIQINAQTVGDTFTENGIAYEVTAVGTTNEVTATDYTGTITLVTIPDEVTNSSNDFDVTAIGDSAFRDNSLTSVTIPNSVTSIGEYAFFGNSLTSITIPSSITSIGTFTFAFNSLTSVIIPSSVTSIGYHTFRKNLLTSVTIPSSVTLIDAGAFTDNLLTSVTIPSSVTSIGDGAFSENSLTSVTIPSSVTSIGEFAFQSNLLTSVTIPSSVSSIGTEAFAHNSSLTAVTSESETPATLEINTFYNNSNADIDLTIPTGTTAAYTTAAWTGFNSVTEDASLSTIDNTFNNAISIYPNPVQNTLNINLPTGQILKNAQVFTVSGEKVMQSNATTISFSNVQAGIYILKIENTAGKITVRKIIKK